MKMVPQVPEQTWLCNWRQMLKWTDPVRPDGTTTPEWEVKLDDTLSRYVLHVHCTHQTRSHNAFLHLRLLSMQAEGDKPFYQAHPDSRLVLMLRLQTEANPLSIGFDDWSLVLVVAT